MRTISGLGIGVAMFALAQAAFGQTDIERATARDAANNGRAAFDAGKYEQAIDYLSRAEQLVHSPTHLLFLARAQTKLGKLVGAHETYLKITRETLAANAPKAFVSAHSAAEQEQEALEGRLPSVTVLVLGGGKPSDLRVELDGTQLPSAMIGIPFPVDPGEHVFKAQSAGGVSDPVSVKLTEGAQQTVSLTVREQQGVLTAPSAGSAAVGPTAANATGTIGTDTPARDPGHESKGAGLKIASIVSFGVGAIGVGLGTYYLVTSKNTRNEADKLYEECKVMSLVGKCANPVKQDEILSKDNDADSQRLIGTVSMIGGGAAVIAGVVFLIVDASTGPSQQSSAPHITPVFGFRSLGLVGTF